MAYFVVGSIGVIIGFIFGACFNVGTRPVYGEGIPDLIPEEQKEENDG